MNGPWPAIDDWMDLVGNLWIGVVLILVAAVPSWLAAKGNKAIKEVKHHVANGHKLPLREDLDAVIRSIALLTNDVQGLRSELASEENLRRLQIQDLREDVDHKFNQHRRLK